MSVDEETLKAFKEQVIKFKKIVDSLPIIELKKRLLRNQTGVVISTYETALKAAESLPATGGCSEYAREKVLAVYKKYLR
jgi:hypothetical protein